METENQMKYLNDYQKIVQGNQIHAPIGKQMGIRLIEASQGMVVAEMQTEDSLLNSLGTIQGGAISVLADVAMGLACGTMVEKGKTFSTLEFKINFIRPVTSGLLTAIGKVSHIGTRSCVSDCEIFNEEKKLVAKSSGTLLIQ